MAEALQIIEPTLEGEAGHCHSFVKSLCLAAAETPVTVWADCRADVQLPSNATLKRFFHRRFRKIQCFWLYRSLLRHNGRLFISTASRTDMVLLHWAARGVIPASKVFLYVHWFKSSPGKLRQLQKLSKQQPELVILTPVESICREFASAGFRHVQYVPYPISPCAVVEGASQAQPFTHLLFAGAARKDKGFGEVVDLIGYLLEKDEQIPMRLQASPGHYGKLDEATSRDLERLDAMAYPGLSRYDATLPQDQYRLVFRGAICLQLYSRYDFADRISGVTLDALSAGSPIITLSGTWIARTVSQFDAGVVVESPDPASVLGAVQQIRDRYGYYREKALVAGAELQKRNSASHLFHELMA